MASEQLAAQLLSLKAENARLVQLLSSVGGGGQVLPASALLAGSSAPAQMLGEMKLWVGSWNMGARDPFMELGDLAANADAAARMLAPFVPLGLDVYVFGVQEGISDKMYEAIEQYTGTFRVPLHTKLYAPRDAKEVGLGGGSGGGSGGGGGGRAGTRSRRFGCAIRVSQLLAEAKTGTLPEPVANTADMMDRVWGRGDGALLLPKFTGIAVFVSPVVAPYTRLLSVYKHSFGASEGSKGGVGVALGLYDVTLAFVNVHQASKKADMRRAQFQEVTDRLGTKMGGRGFGLTEAFHHVVWMGDLNTHCRGVSAGDALELIRTGRHLQLLLQHDELLMEKEAGSVFCDFEEPLMAPRFFPTYKKLPGRGAVDTREADWTSRVYITAYKEPFYKGGRVQERVPSWTDRIQYHSLADRWGELLPEALDPTRPDASPHNYHAVNDGLDTSDHAPIYATFSLQIAAEEVAGGVGEELRAYVAAEQERLGYRQDEAAVERADAAAAAGIPASPAVAALALPPAGPMADADFSALHPSLRPLVVVLRLGGLVVDAGGASVVPRAVAVQFPLPFEDSDLVPERHKVVRPSSLLPFTGRGMSALSVGLRTVVSKQCKLESLHLLLRVTLDDNTKAQCVIAMKHGGFHGLGSHMNTFKQPLIQNGVALKAASGAPVCVTFTLEMHAYERGGAQAMAAPAPAASLRPATFAAVPATPAGAPDATLAAATLRSPPPALPAPTPNNVLAAGGSSRAMVVPPSPLPAAGGGVAGVNAEAARLKATQLMAAARARGAASLRATAEANK